MYRKLEIELLETAGQIPAFEAMRLPKKGRINDDRKLCSNLVKAGDSHGKFSRGIVFWLKTSFQVGFMVELDTYRIGREVLSTTSSMHTDLKNMAGEELAEAKQADLPGRCYTQIAMYSAPCLRRIYKERKAHRHPDWQIFCEFIETLPGFGLYIYPERV